MLSGSAFIGCLAGLASGAGVRAYELREFPLPDLEEGLDVFLSYSHSDSEVVLELAEALRDTGLSVWLDRWNAPPGSAWPERIETAIESARSVAILRGTAPLGHWQRQEIKAFHTRSHDGLAMIPVLLPGSAGPEDLGILLADKTAIDLREGLSAQGIRDLADAVRGSTVSA